MADLAGVESVLVSLVAQSLYPNGTGAASATGDRCKVFRGWPVPANLDADLKARSVNVSVVPLDAEQNATRYPADWQEIPRRAATLTLTASGTTVSVGGTANCPLNAAVIVNDAAYVYPLQWTDTPTSVATALAALIGPAASSSGGTITIPGAIRLHARVGAVGTLVREVKRQKKTFRITAWCHAPLVRDRVSAAIDAGLSALTFLSLADGTAGRIRYERSRVADGAQKSGLYRRDLEYSVDYATTQVQNAAEVVAETITISGGSDPNAPPVKTITF